MKEIMTELISKKDIAHKNERKLTIPSSVITIKNTTFKNDKYLIKVSLSKNLQKLEKECFESCSNLEEVRFVQDSKLTVIPKACFKDCTALKKINIPTSIVSISEETFMNCQNIEYLEIPKEVVEIKENAFLNFRENQTIIVYKDYEDLENSSARIVKIEEDQDEDVIEKDEKGRYKFEVTCKCGHVGKASYIPVSFPIKAKTKKEASEMAIRIPRVKHEHSDVILGIKKIGNKRFRELSAINRNDIYLNVKGKKDIKDRNLENEYKEEVEKRKLPEKNYSKKYNKNIFKGRKRKVY